MFEEMIGEIVKVIYLDNNDREHFKTGILLEEDEHFIKIQFKDGSPRVFGKKKIVRVYPI